MENNLGKHLILGFDGTMPSEKFLEFIRREAVAGVILFKRNIESREQVKELIHVLQQASEQPLLVSVDHEGGRVFRLPEPFTRVPPARLFGDYYKRTGDLEKLELIASLIALEIRSVGFNLNYAPVLDVDTCADNPIIGDRSFSQDPQRVGEVAAAFIRGFAQQGLLACGKHFPGHGDTAEDSHLTLPSVNTTLEMMQERELVPFRAAIAAGVPALMTAHVLYEHLDSKRCGTLSATINQHLLRKELGFDRVLMSDDMFMHGVRHHDKTVAEVCSQALFAGCDQILLCQQEAEQPEIIEELKYLVSEDAGLQAQLELSSKRVAKMQAQLPAELPVVDVPALGEQLASELAGL